MHIFNVTEAYNFTEMTKEVVIGLNPREAGRL